MEENVALDSNKQKQFIKSIKGIKKIIKGKDQVKSKKENVNNVKIGKIRKPIRKKRGLVYLSHIPHGFYEHQMTEYFKQFGVVTNARVIRSKRTGMSKGHAFVEFKDPNVAEIVAETMNNYLMGKRLIKAAVIPPEKQRKFAKRKHWNAQNNPANDARQKMKKAHNSVKDEKEELQVARKLLSNLNRTKKKLRDLDIDYDFFTPVDIPELLLKEAEVKKEDVRTVDIVKKKEKKIKSDIKVEDNVQSKSKKNKAKKIIDNDVKVKNVTLSTQVDSSKTKKIKKSKETLQSDDKTNLGKASIKEDLKNTTVPKVVKDVVKLTKEKEENRKVGKNSKSNKIQEQKETVLKKMGVKQPENFIKVQNDSDNESDSSVNFDSDEYDKVMKQGDSDVESDDESDADLDEEVTSEDDASEEDNSSTIITPENPSKAKVSETQNKKQAKKQNVKKPSLPMKMMPQKAKAQKKPKFEKKSNKKTINKVIKKK